MLNLFLPEHVPQLPDGVSSARTPEATEWRDNARLAGEAAYNSAMAFANGTLTRDNGITNFNNGMMAAFENSNQILDGPGGQCNFQGRGKSMHLDRDLIVERITTKKRKLNNENASPQP